MKKFILLFCLGFFGAFSVNAQHVVSASGSLGWSIPGGSGVSEEPEDLNLDGGIGYNVDVLYHLNGNLGVGIAFTEHLLAGGGGGDIDIFGLRFTGVKAQYRLKEEGFTPFVGLGIGLTQLLTPEFTITDATGNSVTVPEQNGGGFGIMPEFGLSFGKFFVSALYQLPAKLEIEDVISEKSVGALNINIGYRYAFDF